MKQVLQSLRTGVTELAEVPSPGAGHGHLLVRTKTSLVSAGTERMLVEFGKAGFIGKAMQQPERVKAVLEKARTDGLAETFDAVSRKLDQPLALGYCNVGRVIELGTDVQGFAVGDRVASNGKHAEIVSVPTNLTARIPDNVDDEEAAFTVLGAIALHGIRLAAPTLGEVFAVSGLGLVGLLTVQLLRAHGCRVLGLDFDPARLELARQFGAETVDLSAGNDPVRRADAMSGGHGIDGVIVTASTKSSEPIHQAAQMCRKRGRIVLVGVTGLELSRADFYEKELTFQVSCSYGPGRYDSAYEIKGLDYPIGYVRWTEQRNFEAVLQMLAEGKLDVRPLISHRFAIDAAEAAYRIVGGSEPSLGVLLNYPTTEAVDLQRSPSVRVPAAVATRERQSRSGSGRNPTIGLIGSGNYATGILLPALQATGARLKAVASSAGVSGMHAARKFGIETATTDVAAVLADETIDAVVIATRHDSHANLVIRTLQAGKHVFVEKPLAITAAELEAVVAAYAAAGASPLTLMVGFNRRFAPHVVQLRKLLGSEPKAMVMTVNAGAIPSSHWTQDRQQGGGRLIGEACHFIDLLRHVAGSSISSARLNRMVSTTGDTASIDLGFADGSIGTIHYFANGTKAFPKERLEVFSAGRIVQLDNFRTLTGFGWPGLKRQRLWRQDKGQAACISAFIDALANGGPSPIVFEELIEVSRATIALEAGGTV
ncbi:dehydrogenase [Devosia insulae DS-56]|uniref:Dehydrogenase n=1 Tax=Devosia insulae DS-56 TaxID=1116389 RepID=A0A1E5XJ83_9HYPH|nr:bi-domain-containing oxidoreductase [Devosia insulae]OEO28649.1 dehydrogenase [Devosia insulae DS-56]